MHFVNCSTSKSAPSMRCFAHMRFAPHRQALLQHLRSQKRLRTIFFTVLTCFDFGMCFAPQRRALFNISTSKSALRIASHHSGVSFFISHLPRWLCTRPFSQPTFQPSGATKHFFCFLFSDLLSSYFLFSDCSHHCCCIYPYCRKLDF